MIDKFVFGCGLVMAVCSIVTGAHTYYIGKVHQARCDAAIIERDHYKAMLNKMQIQPASAETDKLIISVVRGEYSPRTLAEKNRNFLNVKTGKQPWRGQIGTDRHGHAIFEDAAWSIRAGAIILRKYESVYKLDTIEKLVNRFAEGNNDAYIRYLCGELNVKPNQKISFTKRLPELLRAMVCFEMGQPAPERYFSLVELKES